MAEKTEGPPQGHPEIDWSKWEPAGEGDVFASVAVTANPDKSAHYFDLNHVNKHGLIEHDVSLSRNDFLLGDNHTFNKEIFAKVMESYDGQETTSFYGIKEFVLSYGESALFLGLLGDPKEGKIPVEYLRVLFEEERVPFKEGWRRSEKPITQGDMNHMIFKLIEENDHEAAEAKDVGFGTVQAVQDAVTGLLPTHCSIM
ncbi:hypothetical protein F5882DRAFT_444622 [Hyaloscypha sp. PMI_1271]|nr:hypothetical protein F5882DRAFT_444622 [Hyaloscypha sp. PMI_1271]